MKNQPGLSSRLLALEVLTQMDAKGTFANVALANAFERKELAPRDRAFVTALVMGVIRRRTQIDDSISESSSRPLVKMPKLLLNILRMAILQLETMKDIPPSAVVDTSNELARSLGHEGLVKFTNGILRGYLRKRKLPTDQDSEKVRPLAQRLSKDFSLPLWMVERWLKHYGDADTIGIIEFAQHAPLLVLRVCNLSVTTDGLQDILAQKKITTRKGLLVDSCLVVKPHAAKHNRNGHPYLKGLAKKGESEGGSKSVEKDKAKAPKARGKEFRGSPQSMPGYTEGLFSIQDEASAFVAKIVDPKPTEFVIDLCAAPGGKTLFLAELMENTGQVLALDKSEVRLELLKKNRTVLGLTNIQIRVADATTYESETQADRVLLDAPCMGTGVINRRPDQRYRKTLEDLPKLVALQRQLLTNAQKLVKSGGILVYSTCSIEPEENIENCLWFLENFPDFKGDDLTRFLPQSALESWRHKDIGNQFLPTIVEQAKTGMLQLLPSRHSVSGFFIARFIKA